ncbi:IS3 family transposase [Paraflavitalea soli]|uniref:IS3 family transposase n=1 Tax=Paraflavitalea soli TaxID=2315862 RepID=A0A3B7MKM3_9BACT|nr:IS3 family transposase [Paraflavitalea soli]AXY73189.1 IS3 family transposase [Paraflavitalea soli]AXY73586.1 IS3 family transposase [Paraflavitalea soli]AXY74534.1 IS3 family transposase [Paraflavitalea soli]AXY77537.1 IS3 family transposase [Paraflavitalea soli]
MKQHYPQAAIGTLCALFGKTRQAYYEHGWQAANGQLREELVLDLATQARKVLKKEGAVKLLGSLRPALQSHNITMGRDRFFKLLRKHNMLQKRKKNHARTTWSDHPYRKWPNLIKGLEALKPQQQWVSDITYLRTEKGFSYLSLITDAYSRKIVGYHVSQNLRVRGCLIALNKAIRSLKDYVPQSLIHHSDRGIQYCCDQYVNVLQTNQIRISMTQTGSPYENPVAERVNGILKTELDLDGTFEGYSQAIAATHKAIDRYNRLRQHMSCDNLTPDQAHLREGKLKKRWKTRKRKTKPDDQLNT